MTLAITSLADLLKTADIEFVREANEQTAVDGNGEHHSKRRGNPLRRLKITTAPMPNADMLAINAIIEQAANQQEEFLCYDKRAPYPSTDPDGSIFSTSTPVISAITDGYTISMTGFPSSYVVPGGTWLSILDDTSRYYLGQVVGTKTASGGTISSLKLSVPLPDFVDVGGAVTVIKAPAKFRLEPDAVYATNVGLVNASLVLSALQTYDA
jgi:hypothetical protein